MATYTPIQRLNRARMALMGHKVWCLYTGLLLIGKLELRDDIPSKTAMTNGRDVWFDPDFLGTMDDPSLRFVLLHENEHKALRQLDTYKFLWDENPQLANIAADFVVNIRLMDADDGEKFITMPPPAIDENGQPMPQCLDTKYRGWSTKKVFDDLKKQGQGKGKGKGKGKGQCQGQGNAGAGGFDEHDVDGSDALTAEEKEALKDEIDAAIRQGGLLSDKMGGDKNRMLEDVLDSQIRWQEILAEFVKAVTKGRDNSSWSKINRRWVASGLYLPGTVSECVGELLVGIDASGSTWSGNQLEGFVGELIGIAKDTIPERITVVWWDTSVTNVQEYTPETYDTMKLDLKIEGGGGTSPSCVTDWIAKQNPQRNFVAAIMLSDGQVGSDWGNWGALPVLWCLNTKGITAGTGQTLYIEEF